MSNFENIWESIEDELAEVDYQIVQINDRTVEIRVGMLKDGQFYNSIIDIGNYLLTLKQALKSKYDINLLYQYDYIYTVIGPYIAFYKFNLPLIKDEKNTYELTNVDTISGVGKDGYLNTSALFNGNGYLYRNGIANDLNARSYSFWLYPANYDNIINSTPEELHQNASILFISEGTLGEPFTNDFLKLTLDEYRGNIRFEGDGNRIDYKVNYRQWIHIVMVSNNNNMKLYVNGQLIGSVTTFPRSGLYSQLVIGKMAKNSGGVILTENLRGRIDDLYVFNKVLTASQVLFLYNAYKSTFNPIIDDYIVNYKCVGNTLDETRNYHTNYYNATGFNVTLSDDNNINSNMAYYFNGINSYINGNIIPTLTRGSISLWVNLNNPTTEWCSIAIKPLNAMIVFKDNKLILSQTAGVRQAIPIFITGWNHIIITVDNGVYNCYINGIESLYTTGTNLSISANETQIGRLDSGYYFRGDITKIRIYNKVLSSAERYWIRREESGFGFYDIGDLIEFSSSIEDTLFTIINQIEVNIEDSNSLEEFVFDLEDVVFLLITPIAINIEETESVIEFVLDEEDGVLVTYDVIFLDYTDTGTLNDFILDNELLDFELF